MTRGRPRKSPANVGNKASESHEKEKLTARLADSSYEETEVAEKLTPETPQTLENMSDLQAVLREIREFRRETVDSLNGIREEIKKTNERIDEAEGRIGEAEERLVSIEEATHELIKLQKKLEDKQIDQEGRARRDNIRLHGIKEGAESGATSMTAFVETLLTEKLALPATFSISVERAHRALGPRPPEGAPPRSIVAICLSYKCKEEIIRLAWEKKGFSHEGKRVNVDHDYAPEVMRKRKEYAEAKTVLRENNIRFQTPFPAKLRVFYQGETCIYNSAAEATADMAERGFQVRIIKPAEDPLEKMQRRMWRCTRERARQNHTQTFSGFKEKLQTFRRSTEADQERCGEIS